MKLLRLLIVIALAGLFSACSPVGQVQVLDRATRQPIPGAMVRAEIYHMATPFEAEIQETDSQGVAKFRGFCSSVQFMAGKPGYLPGLGGPGAGPVLLTRGVAFPEPSPRGPEEPSLAEAEQLIRYEFTKGYYAPSRFSDHYPGHTSPALWDRWQSYLKTFPPMW